MKYVKFFLDDFYFMAKGFWLVTTTVTNPVFVEYVQAFQPWVESLGGSVFAKDMEAKLLKEMVEI